MAEEEQKPKKIHQSKKKKEKTIISRGKRKQAIARARIKEGKGVFTVNGFVLDALNSQVEKEIMSEPLSFVDSSKLDIQVTVRGGGKAGQAQAVRTAVANALVAYLKDDELRKKMLEYDRTLLVEDVRRVEPKKFKGPKARARFTKSYR